MSRGINLAYKKSSRIGRGKYGINHNCLVTARYLIQIENQNKTDVKSYLKMCIGKIDVFVKKTKNSDSGTLQLLDNHGHHEPHNKMKKEKYIKNHIEKYPKYQSHYSSRQSNQFISNVI